MKKIAFALLAAISFLAVAGEYSVVAVDRVESISRLDQNVTGNLSPWEIQECAQQSVDKLECISNSCGFAEAKYRVWSSGQTESAPFIVTVRLHLGEWCELKEFTFDDPQALILRKWQNTYHLIDHVEVVKDEKGNGFIPPGAFTEQEGLGESFEDVVVSRYRCWDLDFLSRDQIADLKTYPYISWGEDVACPTKGVPLDVLQRIYSNKNVN